jgi:predicted RNA binding protein YcfA (HicA-like mRNA interferase family)
LGAPLKVREIIRLIEADGWYRIKSKGGHRQYKHPVKRGRVTVPGQMNAELDKKTEKSIFRQAGLE